jgi:hypothetical protein
MSAHVVGTWSAAVQPAPSPRWIEMVDASDVGAKTRRWDVWTKDRVAFLGVVKFYPRWRKYAFFPNANTLYEADCLRDIARFCEEETSRWRAGLRRTVDAEVAR